MKTKIVIVFQDGRTEYVSGDIARREVKAGNARYASYDEAINFYHGEKIMM